MKKKQAQEKLKVRVEDYDWVMGTATAWAVTYQGQMIQLRKDHVYREEHKYLPTTSTQRGTAERLALRLNEMYGTRDFKAVEITPKTPH
jgi:hypothetical protein